MHSGNNPIPGVLHYRKQNPMSTIGHQEILIKEHSNWGMRTSLSVLFGFSDTLRACRHACKEGQSPAFQCSPLRDVIIISEAQKSYDEALW